MKTAKFRATMQQGIFFLAAICLWGSEASSQSIERQLSAGGVVLVTRATPTAGRQSLTEAYLVAPMLNAGIRTPRVFGVLTLDGEGLTAKRGELTTGMHGEGYVDRRHPHTYLHELMAGAEGTVNGVALSVTAGKGFVPFGSDDPMLRAAVKYPINHHLAQILERATVVAGLRYRFALLEGAVFNGDEPDRPSASPKLSNFGDSWAARLIVGDRLQASASYAFVTSPENRDGQALDQKKQHASLRWSAATLSALAEWARSREEDPAGDGFTFTSLLGEATWRFTGGWTAAARLERTDRPEEDRTSDPFRAARPALDQSLVGVTRWSVVTLTGARQTRLDRVRLTPFVEVSLSHVRPRGPTPFQPDAFYGGDRLWMISLGTRLLLGPGHVGMGYYGVRRTPSQTGQHQH